MEENDKSRINLRHPAYYTLLWIIYIDNKYKMHRVLKARNYKYLIRMYWIPSKLKYRNAKFIYRWHLTKES